MRMWKGFITKKEAEDFKKKNKGYIAGENGPLKDDYNLCLQAFGMDPKYKFVVIYNV